MKSIRNMALVCGVGMSLLSQAQADLIVNGSFESPDVPTGTYQIFTGAAVPGWITTDEIEIQDHVAGSPLFGNQFVELDANHNSYMFQTIATTPSAAYTLSFAYSPRPRIGVGSNGIDAWWNGSLLQSFDGAGAADTDWTVYNFSVIGTGSDTVKFVATGTSDSLGGYLDKVELNGVPDAGSTLALLGGAFAMLGALGRKFRK
jgi:hypothetical protein